MRFYLAAQISNLRKRFYDNFSLRSNTSGNLGTATDGSRWTAINGVIQIFSGKAKATTIPTSNASGSSYPMATVDMPTYNNIIDITDTYQGAAVALWVQSSNDWWIVDVDSTFNTIPGNSNYGVVGSNYGAVGSNYGDTGDNYGAVGTNYGKTGDNFGVVGNNFAIDTYNTAYGYSSSASYTSTTNYVSWSGNAPYFTSYGFAYGIVTNYATSGTTFAYGTPNYTYTTAPGNANYKVGNSNYGDNGDNYGAVGSNYGKVGDNFGVVGSNYGTVNSNYGVVATNATTYAYAQYLRIKQSSSGIVSTITSALISASQTINSLRVQISGNQITAKAYSDAALVTQIGSDLVHTATGAVVTTKFGIALSPSEYNQSDIIGSSVNITRV